MHQAVAKQGQIDAVTDDTGADHHVRHTRRVELAYRPFMAPERPLNAVHHPNGLMPLAHVTHAAV